MTEALLVPAAALAAVAVGAGYRVVRGPTVQDRLLAVNAAGTTTVAVIALVAAAFDAPGYLDVALVYALLNFLLSIGVASVLDGGGVA